MDAVPAAQGLRPLVSRDVPLRPEERHVASQLLSTVVKHLAAVAVRHDLDVTVATERSRLSPGRRHSGAPPNRRSTLPQPHSATASPAASSENTVAAAAQRGAVPEIALRLEHRQLRSTTPPKRYFGLEVLHAACRANKHAACGGSDSSSGW